MTQSRQIQVFGFLATFILILFIVIFLGKDFYTLYQHYMHKDVSMQLDDTQVIRDAAQNSAVTHISNENKPTVVKMEKSLGSPPQKSDDIRTIAPVNGVEISKSEPQEAASGTSGLLEKEVSPKSAVEVEKEAGAGTENVAVDTLKSATVSVETLPVDQQKAEMPSAQKSTPATITPLEEIQALNHNIHILLQKVPFFHGTLQLTAENRKILDQVVKMLKALPYPYVLEVEGHTASGLPSSRSKKMAQTAAGYLQKEMPNVKIETSGYGNRYPISDDLKDPANTRIEIIVRRSA